MSTTGFSDVQVHSWHLGTTEPAPKLANVAASATLIYPGYPVSRAAGLTVVLGMATNKPDVSTPFVAGVATTQSTNTAGAAGTVSIIPNIPGIIWRVRPLVPASWDTQAEYDALVGKRVLMDLTSGTYTIIATDGANNGCVIEPLNVSLFPGWVAFSFRQSTSDLYA